MTRRRGPRRSTVLIVAAAAILCAPIAAPSLLAFPYKTHVAGHAIYSETPIAPSLAGLVRQADAKVLASPIGKSRPLDQDILLTDGGWRWYWLANRSAGAFGLTRPLVEAVIVNRSDQTHDTVANGAAVGGHRSLSGTMAHEMTHGAIRAHFGTLADARYPVWVREGYCDYVSGGGSLSDADAGRLARTDPGHPALPYYRGRKDVEARLAKNGGSVDALFAGAGNH